MLYRSYSISSIVSLFNSIYCAQNMSFFNFCGVDCCPQNFEHLTEREIYQEDCCEKPITSLKKIQGFQERKHKEKKKKKSLIPESRKPSQTQLNRGQYQWRSPRQSRSISSIPPIYSFSVIPGDHPIPPKVYPKSHINFLQPSYTPPIMTTFHANNDQLPMKKRNDAKINKIEMPPGKKLEENYQQIHSYLKPDDETETWRGPTNSRKSLSEFQCIKTESVGGSDFENSDGFSIVEERQTGMAFSHLVEPESPAEQFQMQNRTKTNIR